jgi:NADPH:quinone reductase-like Zn-dependent oxidoreductase
MLVAGIRRAGAPVEVIETDEPRPLAGDEVLLEVAAAGVGNWDEFVRVGGWDVGAVPPTALGVEAAGTVTAVGGAVSDWTPGDAVLTHPLPLRGQGTWAPMLIAPAALLARKPASVSWEVAAAFPVPALTAEQVLSDALRIRAGEHVLVHGAGGVTGGLLVALAALRGAQVTATAGPSSRARVSALGARHVIDYHDQDWPEQVRAVTDGHGPPSPPTRPPGSAASPSTASTSARTDASCATSRPDSGAGSWRSRPAPATAWPMRPGHLPG